MNQYQAVRMSAQHGDELRALADRGGQARQARAARRAQGQGTAPRAQRRRFRRRTGWALVALGLRLAYAAGED